MSYMGDLGFVEDVQTGNPIPSSRFDISMVSINEQFSPLIGMDATLKNGLTAKVEYKTSRILNLSMSACQLVETASRDFVIGLGYKIVNFNLFSRRNVKDSKNRISHDLALAPTYHSVTSRPFAVISNKDLPKLPMETKPLKYPVLQTIP